MEEWCLSQVGRRLYELFVEDYSEKQWGRHPRDLPTDIIKRIPVRLAYDESYFGNQFQGIPVGGYTALVEKMLKDVQVRLGEDYDEDPIDADLTIYTGPIDAYFSYQLGHLEYRSLRFEDQMVDVPDFQGNSVVNYTDKNVPFTRILEHKHFDLIQNNARTLITREYPDEWRPGKTEFYPVNDQKNNMLFKKYQELAQSDKSVHFGGRLGEYRYADMDQIIASALKFCEKLT
jgi:UDP-galactopyranose mutase